MVGIHGFRSRPRPLVAARKATDRLDDQMTQARDAREKARVLRGFPDGRPHDDAASREAPDKRRHGPLSGRAPGVFEGRARASLLPFPRRYPPPALLLLCPVG